MARGRLFVGTNLVVELALPDERFRGAMTASATGGLDILIAPPRSRVIAHLDGANVTHEGDMAEGLDTSDAGTLSDATLSPGPIVAAGKDSRSKPCTNQ